MTDLEDTLKALRAARDMIAPGHSASVSHRAKERQVVSKYVPSTPERNAVICAMSKEGGLKNWEIGRKFGLSGVRVRQIVLAMGCAAPPTIDPRLFTYLEALERRVRALELRFQTIDPDKFNTVSSSLRSR